MKVFVIGGTGAVGRYAVRALIESGHAVTAIARSEEKASQLRSDGAAPVEVSIFDREALAVALAGQDVVVNLATAIPPVNRFMSGKAWAANERVRVEGSTAIVDAAISANVGRLIQESVVMIYSDGGSDWIDEASPTDRFPMAVGNHAAEANAARVTDAGAVGVVLRFGWFYGPGATHSEQFFAIAKRHGCVQMGRPSGYVSSIHLADAGAAIAAALDVPAGIHNVVDDEPLTKRDYAAALATSAGSRAWLRYPGSLALLLGNRTTSLTRSLRVSNAQLRHASAWTPRFPSAREGWLATAHALSTA